MKGRPESRSGRRAPLALVALALIVAATPASARRRPSPVDQANGLLAQLTVEEKIALAADGSAGVPRLGIPGLAPSDGPNGIRNGRLPKTAFPNAEVVAASWDTALAERFGVALGSEAAA